MSKRLSLLLMLLLFSVIIADSNHVRAADEYGCPGCLDFEGDLSGDCFVDLEDYSILAGEWLDPAGNMVYNGDFEIPQIAEGTHIRCDTGSCISGWTREVGYTYLDHRDEYVWGATGIADGQWMVLWDRRGNPPAKASQTLEHAFLAETQYTLMADVGSSHYWYLDQYSIRVETTEGEVLAEIDESFGIPFSDSWLRDLGVTFTTGRADEDTNVGRQIRIFIEYAGSGMAVDNIRLYSSNPDYVKYSIRDLAALSTNWLHSGSEKDDAMVINSQRQLFVDDYLIDSLQNTTLKLHHPRPAEKAVSYENPWEGRYAIYSTVLRDQDVYRMYYRGYNGEQFTCYAESPDGINWIKPSLEIYQYNGSGDNNIILDEEPFTHNFAPFLDTRPGVAAQERYKALAGGSGLVPFVSGDGIHWTKFKEHPVITQGAFDSQNVSFWSDSEQCYVCYFRTWTGGYRRISRTTSSDYITWTQPVLMGYDNGPLEHLYVNQTSPYFRAPQIYLALAARFMPGRRVLTAQQCNDLNIGSTGGGCGDISGGVLLSTRGGDMYNRTFLESFVRPGIGNQNWVSRSNYPACGVVQTGPDEMSIYVQREYGLLTGYLQRMTLRLDGFASVNAPYQGGEMITRPLKFFGEKLEINYSTSECGSIRIEIQNPDGSVIPGYSAGECNEIIGDEISRIVTWKGSEDLGRLSCMAVRLRFVMKDADLYSLKFKY